MTAKWKWNTTNIYVSDEDITQEIKRAEQFVLDATKSTYTFFGTGSPHYTIKGLVLGETDKATLLADALADQARTLTRPWGTVTNAKINKTPKFTAKQYSGATIDGVTYDASVTPIYMIEMEIVDASP